MCYGPHVREINCGLCMRWECWECYLSVWLQRKLRVNNPDMHHNTCVTAIWQEAHVMVSQALLGLWNDGGGTHVSHYLIEADWCIYASVNYTIIGSDLKACRLDGAKPLSEPLLIGPLGTNFNEFFIEIKIFSLTNLNLKVTSAKMTAILSRPQCVMMMYSPY